jgi:protein-tyrosine-phosphatase
LRRLDGLLVEMADAERENLAQEAARAWSDARSLLFVCLGNVCRSPFAEALTLRRIGRRQAISAGHYPVSGRRPPELALVTAKRFGLDLGPHRSRVLSGRMVEEADAVFVFDEANREAVVSHHPGAAERTHLLGALSPEGPLHIADPFGGPRSLYEAVYRDIAGALAAAERTRE